MNRARLVCDDCSRTEPAGTRLWRCPCGGPFSVAFRPTLNPARLRPDLPGLWRYVEALPVSDPEAVISLGEGMTPLVPLNLDRHRVLAKCEFCNPTGSYKDRGWTLAVSRLRELGVEAVVEDSSGNAGASLAAYGARAGITVTVFVPADAPSAKRRQIAAHGAGVVEVAGSRQAVTDACLEAAGRAFYAGHAWNPWFLYGVHTLAWEILEQGGGAAPAVVFAPVGQGGIILGLYHGFDAMVRSGYLATLPRLVGVQAAACAPVVRGFAEQRADPPPVEIAPTLADGIRTPRPVRYRQVLDALRLSQGKAIAVDEEAIRTARDDLARQGFFVEPTAAVAAAGARKWLADRREAPDGPLVVVLTGHGLKAMD